MFLRATNESNGGAVIINIRSDRTNVVVNDEPEWGDNPGFVIVVIHPGVTVLNNTAGRGCIEFKPEDSLFALAVINNGTLTPGPGFAIDNDTSVTVELSGDGEIGAARGGTWLPLINTPLAVRPLVADGGANSGSISWSDPLPGAFRRYGWFYCYPINLLIMFNNNNSGNVADANSRRQRDEWYRIVMEALRNAEHDTEVPAGSGNPVGSYAAHRVPKPCTIEWILSNGQVGLRYTIGTAPYFLPFDGYAQEAQFVVGSNIKTPSIRSQFSVICPAMSVELLSAGGNSISYSGVARHPTRGDTRRVGRSYGPGRIVNYSRFRILTPEGNLVAELGNAAPRAGFAIRRTFDSDDTDRNHGYRWTAEWDENELDYRQIGSGTADITDALPCNEFGNPDLDGMDTYYASRDGFTTTGGSNGRDTRVIGVGSRGTGGDRDFWFTVTNKASGAFSSGTHRFTAPSGSVSLTSSNTTNLMVASDNAFPFDGPIDYSLYTGSREGF